jgi:hypothetical protein
MVLFLPVVEQCGSGQKSFLCHHQLHSFQQVSFVPAIVGLNSGEGGMDVSCKFFYMFVWQVNL